MDDLRSDRALTVEILRKREVVFRVVVAIPPIGLADLAIQRPWNLGCVQEQHRTYIEVKALVRAHQVR